MKKVYLKGQLKKLKEYPVEFINNISVIIGILEENYGVRDVDRDLGDYVLIVESIERT